MQIPATPLRLISGPKLTEPKTGHAVIYLGEKHLVSVVSYDAFSELPLCNLFILDFMPM